MNPYHFAIAQIGGLASLVFVSAILWGRRHALSARLFVLIYAYLASFVALAFVTIGLSGLLTGVFALADPDFSYARPPVNTETPVEELPYNYAFPAMPEPSTEAARLAQERAQQQQQQQQESLRERARQQRQLRETSKLKDEQNRQLEKRSADLIRGTTFAIVGSALFVIHMLLRGRLRNSAESNGGLVRGWLMLSLLTFGISGVLALPSGIADTLKFLLVVPLPIETRVAPGPALAAAIVFVPVGLFFLLLLLREIRHTAEVQETRELNGAAS